MLLLVFFKKVYLITAVDVIYQKFKFHNFYFDVFGFFP